VALRQAVRLCRVTKDPRSASSTSGTTTTGSRTHGNEYRESDENGLMRRRDMSANDIPIDESERRYR
jgi:nuclear transport factor 2 (NTF2) superfamily protein